MFSCVGIDFFSSFHREFEIISFPFSKLHKGLQVRKKWLIWLIDFWCLMPLSAIFQLYHDGTIVVEETGVPGENHRPWASNWSTLSLAAASRAECTLFCNLQSQARTHAISVIGLYELLGNPTTYLIEPPGP